MKILLINSSPMYETEKGTRFVYKETGKFLLDLQKEHSIENFHYLLKAQDNDAMANFDLAKLPITITTVNRYRSKVISYLFAYIKGGFRLLRSNFAYIFYPNSFAFIGIIAWLLNKPYALYIRGEKGLYSKFSKFLYRKASFVLTVSPFFTKEISRFNPRTFTIRPMIAYSEQQVVKDRSYNNPTVLKLLFVGRIEREKGVFELVEAVHKLIQEGTNQILVTLIGDGKDTVALKERIRQVKGLDVFFNFTGSIFDDNLLKDYYLQHDLFILPTYHEGFPRVLYEAMIFGIPIITTFVGSIGNVMTADFNCIKIYPRDVNSIYFALRKFIVNYATSAKIAQNGTLTISEYLKKYSKSHLNLFEENLLIPTK